MEWEKQAIHTQNEQFVTSRALHSPELSFRPPSKETGLPGLYRNRFTRPYYANLVGLERLMPTPLPGVKPFDPRPESDEELTEWDISDLRRLGLELCDEDDLSEILARAPEGEASRPPPETPLRQEEPRCEAHHGVLHDIKGVLTRRFRKDRA